MATLYISYFGGQDVTAQAKAIATETITTSSTSAVGGTIPASALYAMLWSSSTHYAIIGTGTPVAVAGSGFVVPANRPTWIRLEPTSTAIKFAAILSSSNTIPDIGQDIAPTYSPGGFFTNSASFNRPSNTTPYAQYQRVADSISAATVLEFTNVMRATAEACRIERVRVRKTSNSLTNASFRLHFFRTLPTVSVNDAGAFSTSSGSVLAVSDISGYIGTIDVTMDRSGTAGARGVGVPTVGSGITCEAAGSVGHETSLWCVVEALAAYTPTSGETFTITIEAAKS